MVVILTLLFAIGALFYTQGHIQSFKKHQSSSESGINGYTLNIEQDKIRLTKYYKRYHTRGNFAIVPLKLANNSADTLTYLNMSCSWSDIYDVNNGNLKIFTWVCESNYPTTIVVAPHKTTVVNLPITILDSVGVHRQKFKIGMHLIKENVRTFDLLNWMNVLKDSGNVIWSNEVKVPLKN